MPGLPDQEVEVDAAVGLRHRLQEQLAVAAFGRRLGHRRGGGANAGWAAAAAVCAPARPLSEAVDRAASVAPVAPMN